MSWQPATDYSIVEAEAPRAVRVKKMIWSESDQTFHTRYFIRVTCENNQQATETQSWLQEQFGNAEYQGAWWRDPGRSQWIWLSDSLATFWQLKWGN